MVVRLTRLRSLLGASALGAALFIGGATAQGAPFYDLPENHWAYESVRELAELGIVTGYPDGRFDGTRATTRYEVAVVAARLLDYVDAVAGVSGENGGLAADAAQLGDAPLAERVRALETALAGAASAEYVRGLEARIVALEASLTAQDAPPPTASGGTASGDVAAGGVTVLPPAGAAVAQAQNAPRPEVGREPVEVRFSARPEYPFFVGISPGIVSTAGDVYLSVQAGYDALIGPVGPVARLTFNGGNRELRVTLDAIAKADLLVDDLKLYGGLGFGTTVRPDGGSVLLEAPFGGEYFVTPRVSLFLQLITSYGFTPLNNVDAELSTGINLRF